MPRDIAAESADSVANLQGFLKDFHANQVKSLAGPAAAVAVAATFAAKDRWRAVDEAFAARDADQLFQIRKQQWITNKLLSGWTMDEINEEIAAGEELAAAQKELPVDPFPWGSVLFLTLCAIGVAVALIYGFTHPNDGVH
jgi:hypothetical protein